MMAPSTIAEATPVGEIAHATMPADLETPASLFLRVGSEAGAFLLESVEGGESVARYSFVGWDPLYTLEADSAGWRLHQGSRVLDLGPGGLAMLRPMLRRCAYRPAVDLPPFVSGLVGYIGYDIVRAHERLPSPPPDDLGLPSAHLVCPGVLYALDHVTNTLHIIARGDERLSAEQRLDAALERLGERPVAPAVADPSGPEVSPALAATVSRARYEEMVRTAGKYIRAGDIFQVVLSQRLCRPLPAPPFTIYRALRRLNPSPYMFHLQCRDDLALVGSSPEMFVRLRGSVAEQRPLAGTRRRGATAEEDARLEAELRADAKERAEHVMLVDLARNDLGRVCRYGSVGVPRLLDVERFSHVRHLVSHVRGELRPGADAIDLLAASLPAGTVSGAPKVRAMEIIDELEPTRRGPYAGAVGYLDGLGNMDTCIAIRTVVAHKGMAYVQAGAGIVADSDPASEYQETMNKAAALLNALDCAAGQTGGRL
ncbi:MAG: anthranilate synthase component I [Anaerolineae bacterium]